MNLRNILLSNQKISETSIKSHFGILANFALIKNKEWDEGYKEKGGLFYPGM